MKTWIKVLIVLAIIAVIAGIGYSVGKNGNQPVPVTTTEPTVTPAEPYEVEVAGVRFIVTPDGVWHQQEPEKDQTPTEEPKPVYPLKVQIDGVEYVIMEEGGTPIRITPTEAPTQVPTEAPTQVPTEAPTQVPTEAPTQVPTEAPTQAPTEVPTQASTSTGGGTGQAPVVVVIIPTQPPMATQVPTEAPTQVPTEAPTQVPTEAPTQVPTEAPTQVPTEAPTQVPTEVPTQVPTEVPTQAPTEVPTEAPTEVPAIVIITPEPPAIDDSAKFAAIQTQLGNMNVANEVLPTYEYGKFYDLYSYIDVSGVNQQKLYDMLKPFVINVVAHSFEFDFNLQGSTPEDTLMLVLESAKDETGRLRLTWNSDHTSRMENVMSQISDIGKANEIILDWLNDVTIANPDNSAERLFVCGN